MRKETGTVVQKDITRFKQLEVYSPDYEYKLHLALPANVFHILKSDEYCFNIPCKYESRISATLINKIILNMDPYPNTSYYNENSKIFDENEKIKELNKKKSEENKIKKYKTDKCSSSKKFYHKLSWGKKDDTAVAKGTVGKLGEVDKKIVNIYNRDAGHYVDDLLETYAKLPYYKREEIFYYDTIQLIKDIKNSSGEYVMNVNSRGRYFRVHPFEVMPDEWSSYNYCICSDTADPNIIHTFRISYMDVTRSKANGNDKLRPDDNFFRDKIEKRGIQFCAGTEQETSIEILMTEQGKDMYEHMVFMRPRYLSFECLENAKGNPYVYKYYFSCTPYQAKVYFQKFGREVRVISPLDLVEHFKEFYKNAVEAYK